MGNRVRSGVLLFLLLSFSARASECGLLLTRAEVKAVASEQILNELNRAEDGLDRLMIRILRRNISNKVLNQCLRPEGCERAEIEAVVRTEVGRVLQGRQAVNRTFTLVRGYGLILSAMAGSAYLNHALKGSIPADSGWGWITELTVPLTMIGILKFGAPFWDRLSSISTSAAFRLREGKTWKNDAPENFKLDEIYARMMGEFTPTQLAARTALVNAVATVRTVCKDAIDLWLRGDRIRAVDRMAELAIFTRKYMGEVGPDTGSIMRAVKMVFSRHLGGLEERKAFADLMIKAIEENDPDFDVAGVNDEYQELIWSWIFEKGEF